MIFTSATRPSFHSRARRIGANFFLISGKAAETNVTQEVYTEYKNHVPCMHVRRQPTLMTSQGTLPVVPRIESRSRSSDGYEASHRCCRWI